MKAVQNQHDEKDIEILWKEDVNRLVNKHSQKNERYKRFRLGQPRKT